MNARQLIGIVALVLAILSLFPGSGYPLLTIAVILLAALHIG